MSFKAKVNNVAKQLGIPAQQVQQNYLIELFLEKLALSAYKNQFIIKGGYLISSMIGLDLRTTMDLDSTITGIELTKDNLKNIILEILSVKTDSDFAFSLTDIEEIRETDDYPGFRIRMEALYFPIKEVVTLDVTTGDAITPKEIIYSFSKIFSDDSISLFAYPIETVLAEKLETVLSRGVLSTRPRDFYDIYIISQLKKDKISYKQLKEAFANTIQKRGSIVILDSIPSIIENLMKSERQRELWTKYQRQYLFAETITYEQIMDSLKYLIQKVER